MIVRERRLDRCFVSSIFTHLSFSSSLPSCFQSFFSLGFYILKFWKTETERKDSQDMFLRDGTEMSGVSHVFTDYLEDTALFYRFLLSVSSICSSSSFLSSIFNQNVFPEIWFSSKHFSISTCKCLDVLWITYPSIP